MVGFLAANNWIYLLLVPALGILLAKASKEFRERNITFGIKEPRNLNLWIPLLSTALLSFALMRPYIGKEEIKISGKGKDILFLIDVSKSMRANDLKPSRLEFAKRKIRDGISLLKESGRKDRLGLVIFSGTATLFCPLTIDTGVLSLYLEAVSDEMTSDPGSSVEEGINEALKSEGVSPHLILLTDGEDESFNIAEVKKLVSDKGATLSAIGVGTPDGGPIILENGSYLKNREGEIVISKLNEEALKEMTEGLGTYARGTLGDGDITSALNLSGIQDSFSGDTSTKDSVVVYGEIAPWLAALSLILIIFGTYKKLLPIAITLFWIFVSSSPLSAENLYQGYKAYTSGDFKTSEEIFKQNASKDENGDIKESLGHSLYRQGKYSEASKVYEKMAKSGLSPSETFRGYYNLGNSKFMEGSYKEAIDAYNRALSVKPNDKKAEFNRSLAEKKLDEKRKEEEQKSSESKDESSKPQESKQEEQQPKENNGSKSKENKREDNPSPSNSDKRPAPSKGDEDKNKSRALETFLNGVDDSLSLPKPQKRRGSYIEGDQTW